MYPDSAEYVADPNGGKVAMSIRGVRNSMMRRLFA